MLSGLKVGLQYYLSIYIIICYEGSKFVLIDLLVWLLYFQGEDIK